MIMNIKSRLIQIIFTLFGLSVLIFFLARVIPGDPARLALGPEATQEQVEDLRHKLGLDKPLPYQYWEFLKGLAHGKMGISLITKRDVSKDIKDRLPATLELIIFAMTFSVIVGVPLGIVAALKKDKFLDNFTRVFAFSGVSFPRFWIGIMFQLIFAYALSLLPLTGRISGDPPTHITGFYVLDSLLTLNFSALWDALLHLALPVLTLSLSPIAQITRLIRANMVEQMRKDYTLALRVNGLPENLNIYKYMLKNAFTSTLTIIGLLFGWLLGNAFVVETVFAWPGMARYGINSVIRKDFNAVVGVTLVVGITYVIINLIVDILYRYLDPRIGLEK